MATQFEVGKTYITNKDSKYGYKFPYTVIKRTAQFIVFHDDVLGEVVRRKIQVWDDGYEHCSMSEDVGLSSKFVKD